MFAFNFAISSAGTSRSGHTALIIFTSLKAREISVNSSSYQNELSRSFHDDRELKTV